MVINSTRMEPRMCERTTGRDRSDAQRAPRRAAGNNKREPRMAADERGYSNDDSNREPRMTRINAERTGRAESAGAQRANAFLRERGRASSASTRATVGLSRVRRLTRVRRASPHPPKFLSVLES